MRALSIMQPWASLIVGGPLSPGVKRTENRGRAVATAARRLVGEVVAIHASKKFDEDGIFSLRDGAFGFQGHESPWGKLKEWPRGAVVGVARLERVFGPDETLDDDERRFYVGDYGLSFGERRHFEPLACLGALGFWTVPADVAAHKMGAVSVNDPQMPNGDCDCGNVPFRHLDADGHVPTCANWSWPMLWQERLGRNLAMAGALCRAWWLGVFWMNDATSWYPGCGRSAP